MRIFRAAVRCVLASALVSAAHGQTKVDLRTQGRNIDFSAAGTTRPSKTGTVLPAACSVGETFLKTDAAAGKNLFVCTSASVWTVQGVELPDPSGNANQVLTTNGSTFSWAALAGDVNGRPGAVTVTGLNGRKLGSLTPLDGQYLRWNGTTNQWEPVSLAAAFSVFGRSGAVAAQSGDYTFAQISGTVAAGQLPSAGGDLNGSLTSARVTGLQNRPVGTSVPLTGQALVWDGSQWNPQAVAGSVASVYGRSGAVTAQTGDYTFSQISGTVSNSQLPSAGGDLSGTLSGATVARLQNRAVSSTPPSTGQVLGWDGSQWTPQTSAGGGGAVSSVFGRTGVVTAQSGDYSFGQISGAVSSGQLPGAGGDLGGTLASATVVKLQNRALSSTTPSTGQVLGWDGSQWTPQSFSGGNMANAVDKTVANTYTSGAKQTFAANLITSGMNLTPGTLPLVPSAGDIAVDSEDANKLKVYDGAQWNLLATATNYVTTFSGQTSVLILGSTHKLGTLNLMVDCYDSSIPAQRVEPDKVQIDPVTFNVTVGFATPQTGRCVVSGQTASAGTGVAGGMTSQLGDLNMLQTTSTVLTVGMNCSPATPCNVRLGSTVVSVVTSSTVMLSGGTGTAFLYLDPAGVLTVGHNLTLNCSVGCAAVSGVAGFPVGSIPLYSWTATNGSWDANGGSDRRAFLSTRNVSAGAGIVALDLGAQTVVAVDSATVPTYMTSTAVLDFGSLPTGGCAEQTFSLPGASTGDAVAPGWPAAMENGLIGNMRVSAANMIAVRVCNFSGGVLDPAAAIYRATAVRGF